MSGSESTTPPAGSPRPSPSPYPTAEAALLPRDVPSDKERADDEPEHSRADDTDSPLMARLRARVQEDNDRRGAYGTLGRLL